MRRLLIPLLALFVGLAACSSLAPAAATVDGVKISESLLQEEVDRVRDDPSFQELLEQQGDRIRGVARRQVLTRLIRDCLLDIEASERGIRVSEAQIAGFVSDLRTRVGGPEAFRQLLQQANLTVDRLDVLARRQIVQQELEKQLSGDLPLDEAQVRDFY